MLINIADVTSWEDHPFSFTKKVNVPSHYTLFNNQVVVTIDGIMTEQVEVFTLTGKITAKYKTSCDLCLKRIEEQVIDFSINEKFCKDEKDIDEIWEFTGKIINIEEVVMENLLLNLPTKNVCQNDCKGLCYKCGTNLNETSCSCEPDKKLSKFGELYKLLKEKENEEV